MAFATARKQKIAKYECLEPVFTEAEFEGRHAFREFYVDAFLVGALGTWDADNEQTLSLIGASARIIRWLACACACWSVYHTFNKPGALGWWVGTRCAGTRVRTRGRRRARLSRTRTRRARTRARRWAQTRAREKTKICLSNCFANVQEFSPLFHVFAIIYIIRTFLSVYIVYKFSCS